MKNELKPSSSSSQPGYSDRLLAQTDALAKLLIEKGLITREEFMQKISEARVTYQNILCNERPGTPKTR
jgi:hypothetical protein